MCRVEPALHIFLLYAPWPSLTIRISHSDHHCTLSDRSSSPREKMDFYLEELDAEKHLHDYHTLWSDPESLIWSYV